MTPPLTASMADTSATPLNASTETAAETSTTTTPPETHAAPAPTAAEQPLGPPSADLCTNASEADSAPSSPTAAPAASAIATGEAPEPRPARRHRRKSARDGASRETRNPEHDTDDAGGSPDESPSDHETPGAGARNGRTARRLGLILRSIRRSSAYRHPWISGAAILAGLLLLGWLSRTATVRPEGIAGLISSNFRAAEERRLSWSDLRDHLVLTLGLTFDEVEALGSQALQRTLAPADVMSRQDGRSLATFLASSDIPTTIFRHLEGDGSLQVRHLATPQWDRAPVAFPDVPLDHPLYHAWSGLLKAGIELAAAGGEARPYDHLTWNEWRAVFEQIRSLFAGSMPPALRDSDEEMPAADLAACLHSLGGAGLALPPDGDSRTGISRLEAFSALSQLLGQRGAPQ